MVRCTFSPARAWRPAAVARLARTLGVTPPTVMRTLLLTLLAAAVIPGTLRASDALDIKGLRIGMTREEVREAMPSSETFTVAGVRGKYPVGVHFHEDRLDGLSFFFESSKFKTVLEALKEKYPGLRCEISTVVNGLGARFDQVYCKISDANGSINHLSIVNNPSTSVLGLTSKRSLDEMQQKSRERKKDI